MFCIRISLFDEQITIPNDYRKFVDYMQRQNCPVDLSGSGFNGSQAVMPLHAARSNCVSPADATKRMSDEQRYTGPAYG